GKAEVQIKAELLVNGVTVDRREVTGAVSVPFNLKLVLSSLLVREVLVACIRLITRRTGSDRYMKPAAMVLALAASSNIFYMASSVARADEFWEQNERWRSYLLWGGGHARLEEDKCVDSEHESPGCGGRDFYEREWNVTVGRYDATPGEACYQAEWKHT